jgi:phosphoserine phosphatase RsbU/P
MKPSQRLLWITAAAASVADSLYLLLRISFSRGAATADVLHTLLLAVGSGAFAAALVRRGEAMDTPPTRLLANLVALSVGLLLLLGLTRLTSDQSFTRDGSMITGGVAALAVASFLAVVATGAAIAAFVMLSSLVFIKRRRNTQRNYTALLVALGLQAALEFIASPNGMEVSALHAAAVMAQVACIVLMVVNSFRFSWILVLTRREKYITLILSFFGAIFFTILAVYAGSDHLLADALTLWHPAAAAFTGSCFLFGALSMGMAFVSTLLHLPTAKEFDRRKSDIASLQTLSRLITQALDLAELTATATHLAVEINEGGAAWLELPVEEDARPPASAPLLAVHSPRNVTPETIAALRLDEGRSPAQLAIGTASQLVVQDLRADRRFDGASQAIRDIASLAVLPLGGHGGPIGALCVSKAQPYEMDRDVLNVLSAFADMVGIAIENSRLLRESIVKERLAQELAVARDMQRRLLPQSLPVSPVLDVAARSEPAYEVGGDYYDVVEQQPDVLGFVVGDVSGKGVSAALYMAQVKGIFQSLRGDPHSTRDLLIRMNRTLRGSMEKRSFISLLYAVLDTRTGRVVFSRAGHCPLLVHSQGTTRILQPPGMALGLDDGTRFEETLIEETVQLVADDVLVMFTDGVTEAHDTEGQEFDLARLSAVVERNRTGGAEAVLEGIFAAVRRHRGPGQAEDDMTVLVLHWRGGPGTMQNEGFTESRKEGAGDE